MIKKFGIILITTLALSVNSFAASDGELLLKKNEPSEIKDCFEKINRVTFWGVMDKYSWLNDWPIKGRTNYPLLFDRNYHPKLAYERLLGVNTKP